MNINLGVIFIVLLVLKLSDTVDWSWFIVFLPLLIPVVLLVFIAAMFFAVLILKGN